MALVNCTECRELISHQARICPKCGKPWPIKNVDPPKNVLEYLSKICVVLIIGFIGYAIYLNINFGSIEEWATTLRFLHRLLLATFLAALMTGVFVMAPIAIVALFLTRFSRNEFDYWNFFFPDGSESSSLRHWIFHVLPFVSMFLYIYFFDGFASWF